ncbi:MAG: glycosyltransferase family 4 protein [Chloroflexota bacterium]|nr:glycosyltransferase family 4 protein [Chloroflexota bacterium]
MPRPRDVILVAFEGPDRYSFVGGLATRMNDLAQALVARGHRVRHIFIGDPHLAATEERLDGRLVLERWSQWISAHHPTDVYDGEEGKRADLTASVPAHLVEDIVAPAAAEGRRVSILFEDWQTADAAIATHLLLSARGLRSAATLLWNSNNTYGYDRIDFPALERAVVVTTVSRFMRAETVHCAGVDPQVLPNGIAERYLAPVASEGRFLLRAAFGCPTFVKVARFDPDKRWLWAIDAMAALRDEGRRARLLMRGSRSDYADTVLARIGQHGLSFDRLSLPGDAALRDVATAIHASDADITLLDFFIDEDVLRALYAAADGVLANSEKEPFGLVGLEVMASGGIAFVGRTGEDYAVPYGNSVVVQTDDPRELGAHLTTLRGDGALAARIRAEGRETARRFAWPALLDGYEAAWDAAARLGR